MKDDGKLTEIVQGLTEKRQKISIITNFLILKFSWILLTQIDKYNSSLINKINAFQGKATFAHKNL